MRLTRTTLIAIWFASTALVACGGTARPASPVGDSAVGQATAAPKRIAAAIRADPPQAINSFAGTIPGTEAIEVLLNSGLSVVDNHGLLTPQLATAVPSLANGLWQTFPDGRMQTTWHLAPGAQWHDGAPLTSGDLAFTIQVGQKIPGFRHPGSRWIESVETPDASTIVVSWVQPYIYADSLFAPRPETACYCTPLPDHLLAPTFADDPDKLITLPYWGSDFIGTGPFRLREFVLGSHILLDANNLYVTGRPKVDEIDVQFIPDPNALTANILSGRVDLTLGRGLSVEDAIDIRDRWSEGRMAGNMLFVVVMFPQFINPNPSTLADTRLRQGLYSAIDRQQMADTIQHGLVSVADSFLTPSSPDYADTLSAVVRYPYDPRRAIQLIESVGYTRDAEGSFRDAANQKLSIGIRANTNDNLAMHSMLAVADFWRPVGVDVDAVPVPVPLQTDRSYVAAFPSFRLQMYPGRSDVFSNFRSAAQPNQSGSYTNPEFDTLIDRFQGTVSRPEQVDVLRGIVGHITENLNMMTLFYQLEPTMIGNRVQHVDAKGVGSTPAWNAAEWDVI